MAAIQRNVANLKLGVAGLLSGTNLESATQPYNALERAFRTMSQKIIPPEAMTSQAITLYDGVFNYPAVSPLFGSSIRDFRPVGIRRTSNDPVYEVNGMDFDLRKNNLSNGYMVAFETYSGVNVMRVKSVYPPPATQIDTMTQIAASSTSVNRWAVGGTASNLAVDNSVFYQENGSLRFNIAAGTGTLSRTLDNAINMSQSQSLFLLNGMVFLELDLPAQSLTSLTLQIGSDSGNYYQVTVTQGFLGAWTVNDFLDTGFDLSTATTVGSPNLSAIKYINLSFVASASMNNVRCGGLFASLPSQNKVTFSTSGIFQNQAGTINNFITNDNDIVLLSDAAYNIYEHECGLTIALQNGGSISSGITSTINAILNGSVNPRTGRVAVPGLYDKYKADNPTEDVRKVGFWYD